MPADESWPRFREAIDLIVKAWTEPEPFGWEGEFFHFRQVSIWPRPRQQPLPQMLLSASTPDSARFAAQHHATMGITNFANRQVVVDVVKAYKEAAHEAGWEPTAENILVSVNACIADTDEEAEKWMVQGAGYLFGPAERRPADRAEAHPAAHTATTRTRRSDRRTSTVAPRSCRRRSRTGSRPAASSAARRRIKRNFEDFGHGIQQMTFKVGNIPNDVVTHGMKLFKERVLPEVPEPRCRPEGGG